MKTDERAWRIGADGEKAVAARLAELGDRWRVLHAVPVGERGSDIDHVVIGPRLAFQPCHDASRADSGWPAIRPRRSRSSAHTSR
ncbi:MAG: NERD domain-containing protein [Actinomycetota bacterium]|nr:NERD domain-containing protein [Actinomycetota bacterium]